jgi:uncharacterized membrane protein required for colicin V production
MGLDLVLCVVILAAAVRGWFRGFVLQAIRLGGLVGSVYAASPLRDEVRPYINSYLPTIRPDLLDRLLWWLAAIVCYAVTVGLASLGLKMARRRPFGEIEPNRTDQFGGFLLGGVKGAVVVAFVAAGLQRHALDRVKGIDWAEHQAKDSYALQWEADYHPADRVWASAPVRHIVGEIRRKGLLLDPDDPATGLEKPVQAAATNAPPRLDLVPPKLDASSPDFIREFDQAVEAVGPQED